MKITFNYLRNTFLTFSLLFSLAVMFTSCTKTDNPTPAVNEVIIQNNAFTPSTITVKVNTTINWTNKDQVPHTITSDTGLFDSGSISNSGTYSHQFTATGTFPYHCGVHPSMTANVVVQN